MAIQEVLVDEDGATTSILTVEQAADTGDHVAELVAMRRVAARRIDDPNTAGPALAALIRQYRDLSKEIHDLQGAEEGDELDQAADSPDEAFDPTAV